jgi:hypothetical protein
MNQPRGALFALGTLAIGLALLLPWPACAAPSNASPFAMRGTLPWHNFLSGPTTWDEEDYVRYLDRMQALGLNYLTFHCYTGGAERYATYVEPLIRMRYRDVLPEAFFDTSLTARWGYRPLAVSEFAFDTGRLFKLPDGVRPFGAQNALLARGNEARYDLAQALMRRVIELAHARGIQVGLGFEFGIHPPEFASLVPPESWIRGANLPDPTHPASIEILRATLDDILRAYPSIDWIWLWLHEHTMHVGRPLAGERFRELAQREAQFFQDGAEGQDLFTGIWSLAYIRQAYAYLKTRAPKVRLAISGWGGGTQLPGTLRGLNRALPRDIVFTCLNPSQGWAPQPSVLAEIAEQRPVWAIPWLEGDARLWHLQPRVNLLREQVALARQQQLQGVLAIHWRTEEIRANLDAFARFAAQPDALPTVEEFYRQDCAEHFGPAASEPVSAWLTRWDQKQLLAAYSPEYNPYDPTWGRLRPEMRSELTNALAQIDALRAGAEEPRHRTNLDWLAANLEFTVLLDEVSARLEPGYVLRDRWFSGDVNAHQMSREVGAARAAFNAAPVEALFRTFARRVRSKGELGELSSLNQRLWLAYKELQRFLSGQSSGPPASRSSSPGRE